MTTTLTTAEIQDQNLLVLPQLPPAIQGVSVGDIPIKFNRPRPRMSFHGLCIDASTKMIKDMLKICKDTKSSEFEFWSKELSNIFTPQKSGQNQQTVVTLSVRSLWDLYFQVRKFPKGSEVLMTAINIGDMYKVVEEHGLIPVPVDLDPYTMAPTLESVKAATTEKTKVCLFAFLFGITYDIAPYADFLNSQGVEIIEDCAQSWRSLDQFQGSPYALMTMFSFGSIKFNAAFFGAITIVRESAPYPGSDALLADEIKALQSQYVEMDVAELKKKINKFWYMNQIVLNKRVVNVVDKYFDWEHIDFEDYIIQQMRGFPAQDQFLGKFRIKPVAALLRCLVYRLKGYNSEMHEAKIANFKYMNQLLTDNGIFVPGCSHGQNRSCWLMPVLVSNKAQFREFAKINGLNVFRGATQVKLVPHPKVRYSEPKQEYKGAPQAAWIATHVVYLPINTAISKSDMKPLARLCVDVLSRYQMYIKEEFAQNFDNTKVDWSDETPRAKL